MTTTEIVLLALCAALVLCPPKYDPALRFAEWAWKPWRRK